MSLALPAPDAHPSTVLSDDAIADPETYAGSLGSLGCVESLEQVGQCFSRHPRSIVCNGHRCSGPRSVTPIHRIIHPHDKFRPGCLELCQLRC